MIVGLFVRVVFSIAVLIACCSVLYIEDWDLILFVEMKYADKKEKQKYQPKKILIKLSFKSKFLRKVRAFFILYYIS
jgi:hypothetical protein